jgi:hypothetical protein
MNVNKSFRLLVLRLTTSAGHCLLASLPFPCPWEDCVKYALKLRLLHAIIIAHTKGSVVATHLQSSLVHLANRGCLAVFAVITHYTEEKIPTL